MTTARLLLILLATSMLQEPAGLAASDAGKAARDAGTAPATVPLVLLRRSAKPDPDRNGGDVLRIADPGTDAIAARAAAISAAPAGYTQLVLRLNQRAKAYLSRDAALPAVQRAALGEPAYLFLSDRQGGFPSESFWLERPDGSLVHKDGVQFVDMVVGDKDLLPGDIDGLEAIYAHELGHLVMALLAGPAPTRASTAVHFVTVKTDAWTAFTEGWGEHYQAMSLDHYADAPWQSARAWKVSAFEQLWYSRFAREQIEGCWICPANLRFIRWQGPAEQRLRDEPIRHNRFVRRVTLPPAFLSGARPAREARMFRDVMPPGPDDPLKNGPEMMESEGVIAALSYRLMSDARLRETYRGPDFYGPFLLPGEPVPGASVDARAVITPAENIYLKLFDVLHRHFAWGEWPALELVRAYAARFPDEAAAVYDVFLDVTRGVTVEQAAFARHNEPGYLASLRQRLMAGEARIDGNIGHALWVVAPGIEFGMGLFRSFAVPTSPTFDINAADAADLLSVPGVSPALAAAVVHDRDTRGAFASVDDLGRVPGMTPGVLEQLRGMRSRMEARLKRTQDRHGDGGIMKDYLALLLKGSYYAAAVWQFGRALAMAGLGAALAWAACGWWLRRKGSVDEPAPSAPRRAAWRRGARAWGRGVLLAATPCLISVAMYAAGILPAVGNMTVVGAAWGGAAVAVALLLRRGSSTRVLPAAQMAAGAIVASALIGAFY